MNIGVSGLMTAQDQLRLTSDNISNVNTPGYIRKVSQQQSVVVGGKGMGVTTGQVTLAADKYLQSASLKASSASAQSDTAYDLLDQIQSQFGDPTDTSNLFNQAASALSSMAQAAEDPTSSAGRQQVLSGVASFLSEGSRISEKIQTVRGDADSRISADVNSVNDLLKSISDLNSTISGATVAGDDATGAQTTQMQYIDQLSKLLDVNVTQNANGGVTVRTQSGLYLTGDKYATLSYTAAASVDATTSFNGIVVTGVNGEQRDLADNLASGEIKGLLDTRDNTAVAINDQLNQYMGKFADAMNAAHNASSAVPAPASLTGKDTSQTAVEALGGFTGKTNLVTLDALGQHHPQDGDRFRRRHLQPRRRGSQHLYGGQLRQRHHGGLRRRGHAHPVGRQDVFRGQRQRRQCRRRRRRSGIRRFAETGARAFRNSSASTTSSLRTCRPIRRPA